MIKSLDQITPADAPRVGGKAHNCARLKQAGFPVPDGMAVMADAKGSSQVFPELHDWLMRLPHRARLAVRSSAADEDSAGHSFAGIHETKLNVPREGVAEAIRACWASVESPRALAYRRTQGLPTRDVPAGVLVQEMIQPISSGVALTLNPVTGARDELVINASWGLGEAVTSGYVDPDEFRVRKTDGIVLSSHIGSKRHRMVSEHGVSHLIHTGEQERSQPSLTDDQLRELAAQLVRIEQFYNVPQDVEWCRDGKQFWILQSRPAKILAYPQSDVEWTRANLREVLPDLPSPQVLWGVSDILNQAMRQYFGRLLVPEGELGPILKKFYGRIYFNLSQLRHICEVIGVPPALVLRGMGHETEIKATDEAAPRPPFAKFLGALPDILRLSWKQLNVTRLMRREEALLQRETADLALRDPGKLSDTAVWSVVKKWRDAAAEKLQIIFVLSGLMIYEGRLKKFCQRVGFQHERLLHTQLATGEKSVGGQQTFDLLRLANLARREEEARKYFTHCQESFDRYREALGSTEFLKQFDAFLRLYGHRGNYESDWGLPRYNEDPTPLLSAIRTHVRATECPNPEAIIQCQNRRAATEWMEFASRMNGWQRLTLIPRVRWLLRKMKRMYLWRERYRSEIMAVPLRRWQLTLAERFAERGWIQEREDYFFLTLDEIGAGMADTNQTGGYRAIVARRKAEFAAWGNLEMPLLMRESDLPVLIRRATATLPDMELTELHGLCVSAGYAEGEVVVIREPTEFARMKPGAILVASATDPSWTPLFTLASGVIVEVGGMLSHAFTVAREYGLPALGNLKDATRLLKNGDHVRLDATQGKVEFIRRVLSQQQAASYKDKDR